MQTSFVSSISRFPSWVPQKSIVVNSLVLATSFSTASVSLRAITLTESAQADHQCRQVLGYDASMMNALNILPSYTEYFHLTSATIALNSGIVWIGAIFGSLILAKVPDIIGRKPSIFYAALIAILGSGIQAASQNIAMFLVARFILGLGIGGTYVAVPLLIAETLPTKYRSLGLGAFTDLYYVGGLLSAGEAHSTSPSHLARRKLTSISKASLTAPPRWLRPGPGACLPSCRSFLLSYR
jgi:hypothetical protein